MKAQRSALKGNVEADLCVHCAAHRLPVRLVAMSLADDVVMGTPSKSGMYRVPSVGRQLSVSGSLASSSLQVRCSKRGSLLGSQPR